MQVVEDREAIGRACISSAEAEKGTATFNFNVPADGKYVIWARVKGPTADNDSFYVAMDGQEDVFDMNDEGVEPKNEWKVMRINGRDEKDPFTLNPRVFELKAGKHTLVIRGRETGAFLDWVTITNKMNAK